MVTVTLYINNNSEECDQIKEDLEIIRDEIPFQLAVINIENENILIEKYGQYVPAVKIGPYQLLFPFTSEDLRVTLHAAQDREYSLEVIGDKGYKKRKKESHSFSGSDQFTLWFSRYYMVVLNFLVLFFVGLPFLAPVFMKYGASLPAKIIYGVYKPLCHQYAFRSWFLFGEQSYYPRELARISNLKTYEEVIGHQRIDIFEARKFVGNDQIGFKVALCERDVAIWGFLFLSGILFDVTGKKLKPYRWFISVWVIFGLIPIGIDGVSQLPSLLGDWGLAWLPFRESTAFLRTLTGGLFGLTTGLYIYPIIEETMRETRSVLLQKMAVVKQTQPS